MKGRDDGAEAALTDVAPLAFLLKETTTIVSHRRTTVVLLDAAGQCHFRDVVMTRVIAQTSSRTEAGPGGRHDDGIAAIAMLSMVNTLVSTTAALRPDPMSRSSATKRWRQARTRPRRTCSPRAALRALMMAGWSSARR